MRDHHAGYIDWTTFEENQRMIRRNDFRGVSDETAGAARAGKGLLAGLLRCGCCGRKLYVRYRGASGTSAHYLCNGDYGADGAHYCVGFGGATVDRRFGDEILRVLSPLCVRASLEALEHPLPKENFERSTSGLAVGYLVAAAPTSDAVA